MLGPVRAISLDLDDTLWEIESVILAAEQALYRWLDERFPAITARHTPASMRAHRVGIGERHPQLRHDLSALRRRALHELAVEAGCDVEAVAQGFAVYYNARHAVTLFDDVRPALAALAARFPLLALTNGNADLRHIGLDRWFDHTVYAAQVGASKPHPAMFEAALARVGARPAEVVHVGDDPVSDVHGARSAGLPAVWVNRKGAAWPPGMAAPQHEVASLGELVGLLGIAR